MLGADDCSLQLFPPTPQRHITPNRGMSLLVPSSLWTHAFRRSSRTGPPATTIHPSLAAADLGRCPMRTSHAGLKQAPRYQALLWTCAEKAQRDQQTFDRNFIRPSRISRGPRDHQRGRLVTSTEAIAGLVGAVAAASVPVPGRSAIANPPTSNRVIAP